MKVDLNTNKDTCCKVLKNYAKFILSTVRHCPKIVLDLFETLSKILCKWKQDSAISLSLYLDSVFKNRYKLVHNQPPVMNRLCPFLLNFHK